MRNLLLIAAILAIGCGGNTHSTSPYVGRWKGVTLEPQRVQVEFRVYESGKLDGLKGGLPCEGSIGNGHIRFADGHESDFVRTENHLEGPGIVVDLLMEPSE